MTLEVIKNRLSKLEEKSTPNTIIFHVLGTPYPKGVKKSQVIELEDSPEDYR